MRVLVLYATRGGSTRGVAQAIAGELRECGDDVTIRPARSAGRPVDYDAVVIGSAIYARHWLKDALAFLKDNRRQLSRMPVAYYCVCLDMVRSTAFSRAEAVRYECIPKEHEPEIEPVGSAAFAGVLAEERLSPGERHLVHAFGIDPGDYRDWDAIRAWSRDVHEAFAESMAAVGSRR